jgi:hypothetical protein
MKLFFYLFAAVLIFGTAVQASNMGFKVTIPLDDSGSVDQVWFCLPYNVSYVNASDIRDDINTGAGSAICSRVYRWNPATDDFTYYARIGGTDFAIDATKSYMVTITGAYNWVVVGSHDPAGQVEIDVSGSVDQNWISVPYHNTAGLASALRTEMIADGITVSRVYKWNPATDDFTYYARIGGTDFTLTPGLGIMVTTTDPAGPLYWTPEHY